MLKLTGGFLIILAGSLLGGCLAWEQDRIGQEMRYLQGLMLRLRGELWYSRTMLPDIFRRLAGEMKEPYDRWLSEMADRMCRKDGGNLVEIWSREWKFIDRKYDPERRDSMAYGGLAVFLDMRI